MAFGPAARPKGSMLVDFVATLARLLSRGGNRIGAILYDNRLQGMIPPRSGRNQVLRLIRQVLRKRETPAGATTDRRSAEWRLHRSGASRYLKGPSGAPPTRPPHSSPSRGS